MIRVFRAIAQAEEAVDVHNAEETTFIDKKPLTDGSLGHVLNTNEEIERVRSPSAAVQSVSQVLAAAWRLSLFKLYNDPCTTP